MSIAVTGAFNLILSEIKTVLSQVYLSHINLLRSCCGQQCAKHFSMRFQLLYCTHEKDTKCGSLHTHIIINAVSYITEAAEYYHIGETKLRRLAEEHPDADFIIMNGNRVLFKRIRFERFLDQATAI